MRFVLAAAARSSRNAQGHRLNEIMHDMSVYERNRITISAARDIFGFSQGRSWADFKTKIAGEQIREFYEVQAALWPPKTDWPHSCLRQMESYVLST